MIRFLTPMLLVCLAACATPKHGQTIRTHDHEYTVQWNTSGGEDIVVDEYFVLRTRINPPPAAVRIDATMPDHRHGMLHQPDVKRLSHDTWIASDMLFHMPGLWRLHVDITDAHGTMHRAETDIVLE